MFSYRKILRQALNITWHNKYLWFFGIFAALLGAGGEYQIINNIIENNGETTITGLSRYSFIFESELWTNLGFSFAQDPRQASIALIVLLLTLAIFIFLVILSISSQAAIIDQAKKLFNKEKKEIGISKGMLIGQSHFWPVLGINILIKLLISFIFFLIALPVILTAGSNWITLSVYVILFLIFIPIIISLSLIAKYSIAFIVIKKNTFLESIKNGFKLFINNCVVSLEMAILLILINIVSVFIMLILLFAVIAPFIILGLIFSNFTIFWLIAFFALTALIIVLILFGSMLNTFVISSWTKLFLKLLERKGKSKVKRLKEKTKRKTKRKKN